MGRWTHSLQSMSAGCVGCTDLYWDGAPHLFAAARVVKPAYEGPHELDSSCEQLPEVRQQDEEHGDPEDGVHDGDGSARCGGRRDVAIACGHKAALSDDIWILICVQGDSEVCDL